MPKGSIFSNSLIGSLMRLDKLTAERQPISTVGSSLTASALADQTEAPVSHTKVNSTPLGSVSPMPPFRSRQRAKDVAKKEAVSLPPQPLPMTTRLMWCVLIIRSKVLRAAFVNFVLSPILTTCKKPKPSVTFVGAVRRSPKSLQHFRKISRMDNAMK